LLGTAVAGQPMAVFCEPRLANQRESSIS
jgi:hypothetical protein